MKNNSPADLLAKDYAFHRVYQSLNISATFKACAEDFVVEEDLSVEFSGDGEHCWIYLQKSGCNTDWVAQQLADFCKVKKMAVSYAGLKDRHAITSQWFSVQLPGKPTPEWSEFEHSFSKNSHSDGEFVRVLQSFRHQRKLHRGALKGNHFEITLRELSDSSDKSFEALRQRCQQIALSGVPNYFGEQRFGRNFNNLDQAMRYFSNPDKKSASRKLGKHKRGMYLSAARSWMFNHILSARVQQGNWDKRLPGDVFMLDGKSACFKDAEDKNETCQADADTTGPAASDDSVITELERRLAENEIHATAAMWGDGEIMVSGPAAGLESSIINQMPVFRDGLVSARVQGQRRACRVIPGDMVCMQQAENFVVSFRLPAGSYATMVLAEIFSQLKQPL